MMTDISPPRDMRGTKLVPEMGRIFRWNPTSEPGDAALAGAVVVDRAAIERRGQRGKALGALLQLSLVERHVDAKVVEEREGHRTGDGNAVLGIGGQVGVAADRGHAIDRQRHLNALVQLRIGADRAERNCRPDWSAAH